MTMRDHFLSRIVKELPELAPDSYLHGLCPMIGESKALRLTPDAKKLLDARINCMTEGALQQYLLMTEWPWANIWLEFEEELDLGGDGLKVTIPVALHAYTAEGCVYLRHFMRQNFDAPKADGPPAIVETSVTRRYHMATQTFTVEIDKHTMAFMEMGGISVPLDEYRELIDQIEFDNALGDSMKWRWLAMLSLVDKMVTSEGVMRVAPPERLSVIWRLRLKPMLLSIPRHMVAEVGLTQDGIDELGELSA